MLSMGYLMASIIIKNNHLVLHNINKLITFLLHALPSIHLHLLRHLHVLKDNKYMMHFCRWNMIKIENLDNKSEFDSINQPYIFPLPVFLIFVWQAVLLCVTEILERNDKELVKHMRLVLIIMARNTPHIF